MLQTKLFDTHNPHALLGLHGRVIRLWRPGASTCHLEVKGKIVEAKKVDPAGLFEVATAKTGPLDYRIYHSDGKLYHDPYAFLPTFGEIDAHLFNQGTHYKIYNVLGGRLVHHDGAQAQNLLSGRPMLRLFLWSVISTTGMAGQIRCDHGSIRSLGAFCSRLREGEHYKFEIKTQDGAYADQIRSLCLLQRSPA